MVFVLVSRSRRVVPDELVTLTSWDAWGFLMFLVMVGWKGKDAVKDGVVAFSCLFNCLRVSLLGFSSFCLTLSMMRLTLSGGVHFVRMLCRRCPVLFVSVGGAYDVSSSCKGSDDTVFGGRGGTGIVTDKEVGVCRFSVDRCGFVGVYEDFHVRKRSIM